MYKRNYERFNGKIIHYSGRFSGRWSKLSVSQIASFGMFEWRTHWCKLLQRYFSAQSMFLRSSCYNWCALLSKRWRYWYDSWLLSQMAFLYVIHLFSLENVQMDEPSSEVNKAPTLQLTHKVGQRIKIMCPISSEKNGEKVSWLKNGQLVDSQFSSNLLWLTLYCIIFKCKRLKIFLDVLPIKMAQLSDSGLYVCRIHVSNSFIENRVNLTVQSGTKPVQ